tara:strand:- start:2247 stop:3305 length:1059 start_codon:yes stop_codon:yes gene_type:complete
MVVVGVISNPASRRNKKKDAYKRLEAVYNQFDKNKVKVVFDKADYDPSPEAYSDALERLVVDEAVDVLAVNSGDGGHHLVETSLFGKGWDENDFPIICNMRGGTVNVRANAANIPDRNLCQAVIGRERLPEFVFKRILEEVEGKSYQEIKTVGRTLVQVSLLDNKNGKDLYGFSFAAGVPNNFIKAYEDIGWGQPAVFWLIAKSLFSSEFRREVMYAPKLAATVSNPGGNRELQAGNYSILLAHSMDITMNFGILELNQPIVQDINDKKAIRFMAAEDVSVWDLVGQVPRIIRRKGAEGVPLDIPGLEPVDVYGKVTIEPEKGLQFIVDADPYFTRGPIELSTTEPILYLTL